MDDVPVLVLLLFVLLFVLPDKLLLPVLFPEDAVFELLELSVPDELSELSSVSSISRDIVAFAEFTYRVLSQVSYPSASTFIVCAPYLTLMVLLAFTMSPSR